jgi:hypothetical protein
MKNEICTDIPPEIVAAVTMASSYMKDETDDWVTIKRMLLLVLPFKYRTCFSTRDPLTKEQRLNDVERSIINLWKELTGVELLLISDRLGKGRQ